MKPTLPILSPAERAKYIVNDNVGVNVSCMVSKLFEYESVYTEELIPITSKECLASAVEAYGVEVMAQGTGWIYRYADKISEEEFSTKRYAIEAAASDFDITPTNIEAYEHYLVTDWLARELEQRGEMIARDFLDALIIWGRTTTGQSIYMDGVISEIALGLEGSCK